MQINPEAILAVLSGLATEAAQAQAAAEQLAQRVEQLEAEKAKPSEAGN